VEPAPSTVTLPVSYVEQLRRHGGDNLSDGIRRLVEEALTATGDFWYVMPAWAQPDTPTMTAAPPAPATPASTTKRAEAAME